ncbi:hypothetical protein ACFL6C_05770 [Myxococcota bacterium]
MAVSRTDHQADLLRNLVDEMVRDAKGADNGPLDRDDREGRVKIKYGKTDQRPQYHHGASWTVELKSAKVELDGSGKLKKATFRTEDRFEKKHFPDGVPRSGVYKVKNRNGKLIYTHKDRGNGSYDEKLVTNEMGEVKDYGLAKCSWGEAITGAVEEGNGGKVLGVGVIASAIANWFFGVPVVLGVLSSAVLTSILPIASDAKSNRNKGLGPYIG